MIFDSKKRRRKSAEREREPLVCGYDYSTREKRQETASALLSNAKDARTGVEFDWQRYDRYYNFIHDSAAEYQEYCEEHDIPWVPAVLPDPWIMVESQIDPNVPEPEFRGRDDDRDSEKAREREFAVRYICDTNRLQDMNTSNERRLRKLGDAFWKAYWDPTMRCGINEGDVRIKDIPVEAMFPDPAADSLQDGQYVDYVYRMHKVRFAQTFGDDLKKLGLRPEEIVSGQYVTDDGLFDLLTTAIDDEKDTVQILEHWFRQPEPIEYNGETVAAGAVACTIQAGGVELRYIPVYWQKTWRQCQLFPFVHYWCIRDENRFWNKSELYAILDLVDAADRKLGTSLLNDAFMANDIILREKDSLADGAEFTNAPGAEVLLKPGKMGTVARLGGLQTAQNGTLLVNWFTDQIQRANRNYETNLGKETGRQTTASGLAMLRSDADDQANIKKADRTAGFERLYELLDWLALEFYDDDRLIFLGAKNPQEDPAPTANFAYNRDKYAVQMPTVFDMENPGQIVRESWTYFPKVDVTVNADNGILKGKQATLNALEKLAAANVTPQNYKLLSSELEILDIPMKKQITDEWERQFAPAVPQEVTDALAADPQMLALVQQMVMQRQAPAVEAMLPAAGGLSTLSP